MNSSTFVLENKTLKLEFSRETGALVGLTSLCTGWKILDRPQLGLSFRLMVPVPGHRNNNVFGEEQKVDSIAIAPDNSQVTFIWNTVTSQYGGKHAIIVSLDIAMTERQAIYQLHIDNKSEFTVENVYCPYLGDIRPSSKDDSIKCIVPGYGGLSDWPLWPNFQNHRGYYGFDYPVQFSGCAPSIPYILIQNSGQGLYAGINRSEPVEMVGWNAELRPGWETSMDSVVPRDLTIGNKDVSIRFASIQLPYIMPKESRSLVPVALEAYKGTWHSGIEIYKTWRATWFKRPTDIPAWFKEPHSWLQLHINSPEDELRIPYTKLIEVGKECARHGVKAIQLVGWNNGGQDQGNPSHDQDPRLGTHDELKKAIADIQSLGVKIILFVKFTWADRATEWFRKDLKRLAVKDPYGDYYMHGGYQYQTASQAYDVNTKRLIPMCFSCEEYIRLCVDEFRKVLDLGAAGILFDECQHHGNANLCFDMSHGHRYGAPVYANDRELMKRMKRLAHDKGAEMLFSGEACYDWELDTYHLAYYRNDNPAAIPLSRFMATESAFMIAVTGFNDRNMINQCLLNQLIVSYEPYNFKGSLEDFPLTLEYGKKMEKLRSELREYFWDGEFCHERGASVVTSDGKPHPYFTVFKNRKNGKKGLVIVNYDHKNSITISAKVDTGDLVGKYCLVDNKEWLDAKAGITVPPCSAAAVVPA